MEYFKGNSNYQCVIKNDPTGSIYNVGNTYEDGTVGLTHTDKGGQMWSVGRVHKSKLGLPTKADLKRNGYRI